MVSITATDLPRFMKCNGFAFMEKFYFDSDSTSRDEGNAAHWLAEQMVAGVSDPDLIGKSAYNGYIVTEEMVAHTRNYVNHTERAEYEVDTSWGPIRGRADRIVSQDSTLYVDDYKYGWSIVEPEENWTLISHAISQVQRHHTVAVLRIFQPRPWHPDGTVREWRVPAQRLYQYRHTIETALETPKDVLTTGSHCHNCPAIAKCPAARLASMNAIDTVSKTYEDEIPNDALSVELDNLNRAAKILKARHDALCDMATERIREGAAIPNYAVKQQQAHRNWLPHATADVLRAVTGIDVTKIGVVTPAEAERRGMAKELVQTWTDRPITGYKLTRIDPNKEVRKVLKNDGI